MSALTLSGVRILALQGYTGLYGAERANIQVLRMLQAQGASISSVTSTDASSTYLEEVSKVSNQATSIRWGPTLFGLHTRLRDYLRNLAGMVRVARAAKDLAHRSRATHIYVPNYIQFLYAWLWIRRSQLPVIFRVGDPPEPKSNVFHHWLWSRILIPNVHAFVANSEYTARQIRSHGAQNVVVIKNALTRSLRPKNINRTPKKRILYVGQINQAKGIEEATTAAIALTKEYDVEFLFAGGFNAEDPFVMQQRNRIKIADCSDKIQLLGFREDIADLYASADIHVCPSVQEESSANVVLEAMAASTPSVVFPRGGLPELVDHGVSGRVCDQANATSLEHALRLMLEAPEHVTSMGVAAAARAKLHEPDVIGPQWAALLIKLLGD